MPIQALEELDIYCTAEELSDKWWQIVSAIDSIGANIAEIYGRYHYAEKINLLYYSRGSLCESKFFVRRAHKRNLIDQATFDAMINDLQVLAPTLNAYIRSKKTQKGTGR